MKICIVSVFIGLSVLACSCNKIEIPDEQYDSEDTTADVKPKLVFKFKLDSTQTRLGNLGEAKPIPEGHAGQHPKMNMITAHYIELANNAFTPLGQGAVLYHAPETTEGGETAIEFSKSVQAADNDVFFEIPLDGFPAGTYEYLRVSLAYQNFDVLLHLDTVIQVPNYGPYPIKEDLPCTVASFVGYNTYIGSFKVKNESIEVNGNRKQGFWGFECTGTIQGSPYHNLSSGQSPEGGTTVVNPLANSSPIPPGSCVVTGGFNGEGLHITGNETSDIVVIVSLSTNGSFEWIDSNGNGKWEPTKNEQIVDMGIRGMIPILE